MGRGAEEGAGACFYGFCALFLCLAGGSGGNGLDGLNGRLWRWCTGETATEAYRSVFWSWLVGWLVIWLVGWLVGWLVIFLIVGIHKNGVFRQKGVAVWWKNDRKGLQF